MENVRHPRLRTVEDLDGGTFQVPDNPPIPQRKESDTMAKSKALIHLTHQKTLEHSHEQESGKISGIICLGS